MPVKYSTKTVKSRLATGFTCDRCRIKFHSMQSACIIRHTFGYGSKLDGNKIEIAICEDCLAQLSSDWSVPLNVQQTWDDFFDDPVRTSGGFTHHKEPLIQHKGVHPGVFYREVYFKPFGIDIKSVSNSLQIDEAWLAKFMKGKTPITVDVANKLSKHLNTTSKCWLIMQTQFDRSVQRLKGIIPSPAKAVSVTKMNKAIQKAASKLPKLK